VVAVSAYKEITIMPYKNTFELNVQDLELIEKALRNEISVLSQQVNTGVGTEPNSTEWIEGQIKQLHELLGKIHNQKIWYGQAHHTGIPIG
jgi:hypothetical protein